MQVGVRLIILWVWKMVDPLFYFFSRLHYIHVEEHTKSVFRVRVTRYKGKNFILSDGTQINKNDLLIKIHLHNVRLLQQLKNINNELLRARLIYKSVFCSLPALAEYLKTHPQEKNIKGIIGITTINKAAPNLGFEIHYPASMLYSTFKKYGQLPIFLLTTSSFDNFNKLKLAYLFMSKEKLFERYITNPSKWQ